MRVLLRVWPTRSRADVVALEKLIESKVIEITDGDVFRISDLKRDVVVEKRPLEAAEGADLELRFVIEPREIIELASKGWTPIANACPGCVHR